MVLFYYIFIQLKMCIHIGNKETQEEIVYVSYNVGSTVTPSDFSKKNKKLSKA